ncbi:MAG: CinA family protein [Bdellovibrionota bacterium]
MDKVEELFKILKEKKATLGAAESCTGGRFSAKITAVPGSSEFFIGSIISYANSVKQDVLEIPEIDIKNHGAVSQVVAEKMSRNVRELLNCTFSVSITGIAGPGGGSQTKPVGTVWFGISGLKIVKTEMKVFIGDRARVQDAASDYAIELLIKTISSL